MTNTQPSGQLPSTAEDNAAQSAFNNAVSRNPVTSFNNATANWSTLTAAQKDTLLNQLCSVMSAILQSKFAITT